MKISYHYLQKFLGENKLTPEEIGEKLTLHTAELEETIDTSEGLEQVVLGQLKAIKPHPKSDKLSIGIFDLGSEIGQKQILFGKVHPVSTGEIYPIALPGTLPSGVIVKENNIIADEKSEGMIADNSELGMKNPDLWKFTDEKLIGKNLPEILESARDTLFDIDNKSLTHRPDLMGIRGFAREISTIFDIPLVLPEAAVSLRNSEKIPVEIQTEDCRRFCAIKVDNIHIKPSEKNTQLLLENLGIRAISNIVDITNLCLSEHGQPMHAFDAEKVVGKIIVRKARNGEKLLALDEAEYELTDQDIVIADEEKVLSIAGIMGGLESGITEKTTSIIYESANFDPTTIRKTSQRLGLRSDSSMRFEKSLDPEQCRSVLLDALEKTHKILPESSPSTDITDNYPQVPETKKILLDWTLIKRKGGISLDQKSGEKILEKLGFSTKEKEKNILEVTIPSFRATKDIAIAEDLIEEIIRMYGLYRIEGILPTLPAIPPAVNHLRQLEWKTRDFFAAQEYLEVYNYSFTQAEKDKNFTGLNLEDYVQIQNPLSSAHSHLRKSLIPNLVGQIEAEINQHKQVQFFEIGRTYSPQENQTLPEETHKLGIMLGKIKSNETELFFQLKNSLKSYLENLGISGKISEKASDKNSLQKFAHPVKSLDFTDESGAIIGQISVLHPAQNSIKEAQIVTAEINLKKVLQLIQTTEANYQKLIPYPSVFRDLSIVLDEKIYQNDITQVAKNASEILAEIHCFDDYRDEEKLGKNLKNLSFHLRFQSGEKTLEENEVEEAFQSIVKNLEKKLSAKLRIDFDAER